MCKLVPIPGAMIFSMVRKEGSVEWRKGGRAILN
jgi:hypothetical protein